MCEIGDARGAERLDVTPEGIRRFAQFDEEHRERLAGYRLALIVGDDRTFGLARMYEALTRENVEGVRVFRDEAAAREWIGLDPEEA